MSEPRFLGLSRRRSGRKSSRRDVSLQHVAAYVERLEPRWLLTVPAVTSVTKFGVDSQAITVWGSGFTGATAVDFTISANHAATHYAGTSINVISDSELTVNVPANLTAPGIYDVTVTGPGGTSPYDSTTDLFACVASLSPAVVAATKVSSDTPLGVSGFSIPVIATADFTPTGNLFVETSAGVATVSYTGIDGTDFTGCTTVAGDNFHVGAGATTGVIQVAYGAIFQAPASFSAPVSTYNYAIHNQTNLPGGSQNAISYSMFWTSTSGTSYYLNSSGGFSPVSNLTSGELLPSYSVPASGGSMTIKLPYMPINSGRIYFSVAAPPPVSYNGVGVATPPVTSTNSIFDIIEPTLDAGGADNSVPNGYRRQPTLHIDTSQVDQFGMPITLTGINYGATSTLTSVGVTLSNNVARDAIFQAYNAFTSRTPGDPYNSLIMKSGDPNQPYRILNPSDAPLGRSNALSYAFDSALKNLFEGTETLTLTVGSNTYTGTASTLGGYKVLKFTGGTDPLYVYEPFFSTNAPTPTSLSPAPLAYSGALAAPAWLTANETPGAMVFGNNGVFTDFNAQTNTYTAQEKSDLGQIEDQIVVALNRGVANLYTTTAAWQNPSGGFYPDGQVSNEYAKFLHTYAINGTPIFINGQAYAISYDDQGNYSSSITVQNQSSVTATLGPWQTSGPAGDNNGFLAAVYQEVLHRAIDPAGQSFWLALLSAGVSRVEVSQGIADSVEAHSDVIKDLYLNLLNRSADSQGLSGFLNLFAAGQDAEQVKAIIYGSPEYFQVHGGANPGFVAALFQAELSRAPDSQEQAYYAQLLAAGQSRTFIASLVVDSQEADQDVVQGYYLSYLKRAADPTGLAYWTSLLEQQNRDGLVQAGILGSTEFYQRL